jgi:hypothetical protein
MPFELANKSRVNLKKVTHHYELHGDDRVLAVSLRLSLKGPNDILRALHANLTDVIFHNADPTAPLAGVEQTLPHRRCPIVELPLKLNLKYQGHRAEIEYGISENDPIILNTCKLDKFEVGGEEGGTSEVTWSMNCNSDVDIEMVGNLIELEGNEIIMRMTAPTVSDGPAIDGTAGHPGAERAQREAEEAGQQRLDGDPDEIQDAATAAFVQQHGGNADA